MLTFTLTYRACSFGEATHFQWRGEVYPIALHTAHGGNLGGSDCILPIQRVAGDTPNDYPDHEDGDLLTVEANLV